VGWKISTSASAGFVLDALEQAIHARRPGPEDGLYKTEVIWRQRSWPSASAVEMASLSEFHGDHLSPPSYTTQGDTILHASIPRLRIKSGSYLKACAARDMLNLYD
jgi:hypothetical protein